MRQSHLLQPHYASLIRANGAFAGSGASIICATGAIICATEAITGSDASLTRATLAFADSGASGSVAELLLSTEMQQNRSGVNLWSENELLLSNAGETAQLYRLDILHLLPGIGKGMHLYIYYLR